MLIRGKSLKGMENPSFSGAHPNFWKPHSSLASSISIYGASHQTVMGLKKEKDLPLQTESLASEETAIFTNNYRAVV